MKYVFVHCSDERQKANVKCPKPISTEKSEQSLGTCFLKETTVEEKNGNPFGTGKEIWHWIHIPHREDDALYITKKVDIANYPSETPLSSQISFCRNMTVCTTAARKGKTKIPLFFL